MANEHDGLALAAEHLQEALELLQEAGGDVRQTQTRQGLALLITGVRLGDDGQLEAGHE